MSEVNQINFNGTIYTIGGSGTGLTDEAKQALLACFEKVAWIDEDGQDYYDALYDALYPPQNLLSISCVYTQPGTVYNTATLDSLKANLVVTAHYEGGESSVINNYTLSGTLDVGTDTITVLYGGKTTTFTVVVTQWSTSPRIEADGKALGSSSIVDKTGASITEVYYFTAPIESFKDTGAYDSTNNYATTASALFLFKYCITNPDDVSLGSDRRVWITDESGDKINYNTCTFDGSEHQIGNDRYDSSYFTTGSNVLGLKFTLTTAGKESSYAYWTKASNTNLLPVGVSDGDIIFAGSNTPYYGKTNINEVTS